MKTLITESNNPLEVLNHFVTTAFFIEKDSHRKGGSVAIPPSDFDGVLKFSCLGVILRDGRS